MKNRSRFSFALVALIGVIGTCAAQNPPISASKAPAVAPVPALGRAAAPTVAVPVPVPVSPVSSPVASNPLGDGLPEDGTETLSNDNLVRAIARLKARQSVIESQQALDQALAEREKALLQGKLDRLKLQQQIANGGREPSRDAMGAIATGPSGRPSVPVMPPPPQPVVRSTYGYGASSYAEIYVGANKVMARPGTVLPLTGHRIVSISDGGVIVVDRRGRRGVWPVSGGIVSDIAPAVSSTPMGLPPAPSN